ncbi:MAG: hypothetical protein IPM82_10045 [Saprospiraceae bacterium]|nr:hypothetical protein [Saprospiraceae bacterium]
MENAIQMPVHQISKIFEISEILRLPTCLQMGKKGVLDNQTSEVFETSEVLNPVSPNASSVEVFMLTPLSWRSTSRKFQHYPTRELWQ